MSLKESIEKYALINAVKFNGKANPGTIIGQLIKEDISLKQKLRDIQSIINEIVSKVNSMPLDKQNTLLKRKYPDSLGEKPKEKKGGLKELPNVDGKVVMRFEPSPSGPLHIGHSYILSLNYEYVKKYGGKLYLRISDTNPENIDKFAYEQIPKDANWLCENNITDILIQSDRLEIYYKYAKKLLEKNAAYICTCDSEKFRKLLLKSKPCPCRNISIEENLKRYENMFSIYKQGDAVMRFKSDIKHKNPAMRDFPLMRINESLHPRKGAESRVWPLMNLAVAVDDMETGITHALRAKDHQDNAIRQGMIHKILGYKTPTSLIVGRINFEGFELSTSKTRKKIEDGIYTGWDDIRLPFIMALKKRGYDPKAIRNFSVNTGITKTDKKVTIKEFFKNINAYNKKIVDSKANRFFFIENPVRINVKNSPRLNISMPLHPDNEKKGYRQFRTSEEFYITKKDFNNLPENKIFRLIDCINVIKRGNEFVFDSKDYEIYKEKGCSKIIHWLPADEKLKKVEVLMDDNTKKEGYAENSIENLKPGDVVQFERFSFVSFIEKSGDKFIFYQLHN